MNPYNIVIVSVITNTNLGGGLSLNGGSVDGCTVKAIIDGKSIVVDGHVYTGTYDGTYAEFEYDDCIFQIEL